MPDDKMIVEISCFEVWRRLSDYVEDDVEPGLKPGSRTTSLVAATARPCWTGPVTWLLSLATKSRLNSPPAQDNESCPPLSGELWKIARQTGNETNVAARLDLFDYICSCSRRSSC